MADLIAKIELMGDNAIQDWAATVRKCWERACEHDNISPDSAFVVFLPDNPYILYYERARQSMMEALASRTAFGYTGLEIQSGKAVIPKPVKNQQRGRKKP
jgi:hypothetical protein